MLIGVPIEQLDSLAALLHPELVERILEAYWGPPDEPPSTYTIDLGWKVHSIARQTGCLDEELLAPA